MKFKVGDKVKITAFPDSSIVGLKCRVIAVDTISTYTKFPYRIKGKYNSGKLNGKSFDLPMMESELGSALKVGQQLLLFEL